MVIFFVVICVVSFVMMEMAKVIPVRVRRKAKDFSKMEIVIGGLNKMKLESIQPDRIVPVARRFKDFVSF